jgi:hypothetical protein
VLFPGANRRRAARCKFFSSDFPKASHSGTTIPPLEILKPAGLLRFQIVHFPYVNNGRPPSCKLSRIVVVHGPVLAGSWSPFISVDSVAAAGTCFFRYSLRPAVTGLFLAWSIGIAQWASQGFKNDLALARQLCGNGAQSIGKNVEPVLDWPASLTYRSRIHCATSGGGWSMAANRNFRSSSPFEFMLHCL